MKSKGFTLIELLAVIVILAIIALIAVPVVIDIISESREKSYKRSIELYGKAVEQAIANYQINNPNNKIVGGYNTGSERTYLAVGEDDVSNLIISYDGTKVTCDEIYVSEEGKIYMSGCSVGTHSVDYTYGSPLCTLEEGKSETLGAKYVCKLDEERTFYVLENNPSSNNITLIMDINFADDYVPTNTSWCTDGERDNRICQNITSIEKGTYLHHIQELFGNNVIVNLPTKDQIFTANSQSTENLKKWLYDNLNSQYSYWTGSPNTNQWWNAWFVKYSGYLYDFNYVLNESAGIRPVITISKMALD